MKDNDIECVRYRLSLMGVEPAIRDRSVTDAPKSDEKIEFTQADADSLAEECGAATGLVTVLSDGTASVEPPADLAYGTAACVFQGLTDAGVTKFGFLGNERHDAAESQ